MARPYTGSTLWVYWFFCQLIWVACSVHWCLLLPSTRSYRCQKKQWFTLINHCALWVIAMVIGCKKAHATWYNHARKFSSILQMSFLPLGYNRLHRGKFWNRTDSPVNLWWKICFKWKRLRKISSYKYLSSICSQGDYAWWHL